MLKNNCCFQRYTHIKRNDFFDFQYIAGKTQNQSTPRRFVLTFVCFVAAIFSVALYNVCDPKTNLLYHYEIGKIRTQQNNIWKDLKISEQL